MKRNMTGEKPLWEDVEWFLDSNNPEHYIDSLAEVASINYQTGEKLEYLEKARDKFGANMTHCLVAACAVALSENPKMNQFVSGRRLYRRRVRAALPSTRNDAIRHCSRARHFHAECGAHAIAGGCV